MVIVIDSREQRPWGFPPHIPVEIATLKTGDYAIKGDENNFAIERKSGDDFLGTISSGWPRFCKEIKRMENFSAKIIIVEADFETFCYRTGQGIVLPPNHEHIKVTPQFVMKRIAELTMKQICVLFAGNAEYGSAIALRILLERDQIRKDLNNAARSND